MLGCHQHLDASESYYPRPAIRFLRLPLRLCIIRFMVFAQEIASPSAVLAPLCGIVSLRVSPQPDITRTMTILAYVPFNNLRKLVNTTIVLPKLFRHP